MISLQGELPELAAAIFDMDDLMIDSHPIHMEVFYEVVSRHGGDIGARRLTPAEEAGMFGLKIADCWKLFIDKFGLTTDLAALQSECDELIVPVFERTDIQPMPGLLSLLNDLQAVGLPRAVASSARGAKVDVVLAKLELANSFNAVISGDEVARGKPAPDIFLAAADRLGIEAEKCVVFEDAKNGVEAAKAAGMFAVGVHNQFAQRRLGLRQDLSKADVEVDELSELTV